MITEVSVKGFQSLHDVTVKLSKFSVIVGPSSSGKSAFVRALRTLTSNQRGDSFITHGMNQASVIAKTDKGTVALLRGKKNEYVLIPNEGEQKTYTKLAGATPEEISAFIGIPAKDPLNYAGQFDMPYLLTASASEVARTLGELTNVSVIFEASREANKRRLAASSLLKTRASDYALLTANLDQYRSLKDHTEALARAEEALGRAKLIQTRLSSLNKILADVESLPEVPKPLTFPDISRARSLSSKRDLLTALMAEAEKAQQDFDRESAAVTQESELQQALKKERAQVLRDAGTCPTCGADTSHVH